MIKGISRKRFERGYSTQIIESEIQISNSSFPIDSADSRFDFDTIHGTDLREGCARSRVAEEEGFEENNDFSISHQ